MKIFTGSSNTALAQEIVDFLKIDLGRCVLDRFSDGEIHFYIDENVRGEDIFIIQSGSSDANSHLMELFIMIDAFKRASAGRITAVVPYFPYARQDWKDRPRVPISARLVADLIETAGANRVLTMDLHSPQIQGFFSIPVDNLMAAPVLANHMKTLKLDRPDHRLPGRRRRRPGPGLRPASRRQAGHHRQEAPGPQRRQGPPRHRRGRRPERRHLSTTWSTRPGP